MLSFKSMLENSDFKMPDLTPEEWELHEAKSKRWEEEQRREKVMERLKDADIPKRYLDAEPSDQIREWAENPTVGLLVQGKVGRGKTYQACAALLMQLERGTAKFTTFDDLLRDCKATFQRVETEKAVISRYANVGMLCIDDMGKERVTEWSLPIIFSIVNKRSMNLKPTIITTQYTGDQLVERMTVNGDSETARAIISRFFEYKRIVIEGKDWRRGE